MGHCTNEDSLKSSKCDAGKTKIDNKTKVSIRPRKVPVTRSFDFFMVNHSIESNFMSAKNNVIKICHQNVRGLRAKCNELLCHLQEQSPHFLCFTEHHLGNSERTLLNLDN
jgi:hypothetical protein